MRQIKKLPTKRLEKFSTVFTQLGLVLVLFLVFIALEHKTEQKSLALFPPDYVPERIFVLDPSEIIFKKESKKEVPKIEQSKPKKIILDVIDKTDKDIIATIIDISKKEKPITIDPNSIIEIIDKDPIKETVPFILIEDAPVFKGCEGLSKKENKICFDKKIKQFVLRNFDSELAQELGLSSGIKKIQTQFIINNEGNIINVQVRAPHPRLEKEAQRIINKLPKFIPGKQRGNPVKVTYVLPIAFSVQ